MTLAELRTLAENDTTTAGEPIRRALEAIDARRWTDAIRAIADAADLNPDYLPAIPLVGTTWRGTTKTPAKIAAARANGKKGGRPRKRTRKGKSRPKE